MNKNDKNILNVPHLRFKDFKDQWTKVYLSDIATIVGGGTPNTKKNSYWNGEINWFTPSEIGENKYVYKSLRKITNLGLKNSSAKILPIGSVLLTSRATIGDSAIVREISTTNQGFQSLIPKRNVETEFLYYITKVIFKDMKKFSNGSTFLEISKSQLENIEVNIPSLEEQRKIYVLLSIIDSKIELQRKLIDLYKSLIKTLRNELFKYKSNNLLGNEINFINGYAFEPKTYDINGKFYVCTISNVSGDRYLDLTQVNKVNEIPKDLNINQQLFSGDILMSLTGNVGRISIVKYSNGLLNQRVAKIDVRNKKHSNFIYHVLSSEKFLKYVEKQSQGSSQNNLYYKNVEKFNLPNYDSNKRLLIILNEIDFLIINYSSLLQSLVDIKFFLLKNMFI